MKLANGSGSIVCLDKTGRKRRKPYAVRITAGWKNGKQVRKYLGYYETQADALVALAEYHKGNFNLDLNNSTLNEVFDIWFDRVTKKGLSASVLRTHKMVKGHFGPIGNRNIKDIKSAHLQSWVDTLDLKPSTKKKVISTLNQVFEYAVSNDIVTKNYTKTLEVNEKVEKTGSVFSEDELKLMWSKSDDPIIQQLLILIYTGMRIGELLSIKREDINFEEHYMTGGSKTEAGKDRIIPIHDKILPLVKQQLGDNKYLINNGRGGKLAYTSAQKRYGDKFKSLCMEHKLHDCRKTGASIMHTAGIPIETVRMIIGHAAQGVTEKVYLFKDPKELVKAINMIKIEY